ncbi:MAG TPA: ATP-dependent 6-phosphofructokinase [Acidimicrobiia bacterium]|jgi:6-phosphofructokinase 1
MAKHIGILTSGGDSPGLNAAIRAIGKTAIRKHGMTVIGFRDGFKGMMQNRFVRLEGDALSGILTMGGTILGTSREKPHRMDVGGVEMDMTDVIIQNAAQHHLDAVICLGGGGTQKNAARLSEHGLPVITLPKTIDRDVYGTDVTFGFDTALGIATEAIDRLHSTAHSHHRIIVVEIMGHKTGWLALGAGIAGGADVILLPEIPYDPEAIAEAIKARRAGGSTFSIVAVSEGARSQEDARAIEAAELRCETAEGTDLEVASKELADLVAAQQENTPRLSRRLEELTGLEARVTILGHVQRGGTPSPADRVLATRMGTSAANLAAEGAHGVMVALRNDEIVAVPLSEVAGRRSTVPPDHAWIKTANDLGLCLGT